VGRSQELFSVSLRKASTSARSVRVIVRPLVPQSIRWFRTSIQSLGHLLRHDIEDLCQVPVAGPFITGSVGSSAPCCPSPPSTLCAPNKDFEGTWLSGFQGYTEQEREGELTASRCVSLNRDGHEALPAFSAAERQLAASMHNA